MRRVLGVLFALAAGVTLSAASFIFLVDQDYELPLSPCGGVQTVQATPVVIDQRLWVNYLCADSRVFMRRFHTAEITSPSWGGVVCPQGFVHTGNKQGCVPPDHPLAGK